MKIELFAQVFELAFISWAEANDLNAQLFKQTCGIKKIKTLSRRWAVVWFFVFVFVFFILVAPIHFFLRSMISRDYKFSWMACSVISPAPRLAKCHCTGGSHGDDAPSPFSPPRAEGPTGHSASTRWGVRVKEDYPFSSSFHLLRELQQNNEKQEACLE